jgi:hypothetical protein
MEYEDFIVFKKYLHQMCFRQVKAIFSFHHMSDFIILVRNIPVCANSMKYATGHSINTGPYGENTEIYSSLKLLP